MLTNHPISRRDVLRAGATAATALAAGVDGSGAEPRRQAKSVIALFLTGGPSQLEMWDPKPDAPAEVRGPFASIATSITGVRFGEHLPRLASMAHRCAVIRSVHHDGPAVHEAGMQLMQTGRLARPGVEYPHFGAVLGRTLGGSCVILPGPLRNTGINVSRGQGAGILGDAHEPVVESSVTQHLAQAERERYGKTAFGDGCARALQRVEAGARCVVVNMFDSLYDRVTWDCHAERQTLTSTLDDYRRTLCPTFDRAFAALLDDLDQRGMFDETLVLAMSEFGRTPRLNAHGGRDHWPGCWSIVLAGGGVRGGQVIGASDRPGALPMQRPVTCAEIVASVYTRWACRSRRNCRPRNALSTRGRFANCLRSGRLRLCARVASCEREAASGEITRDFPAGTSTCAPRSPSRTALQRRRAAPPSAGDHSGSVRAAK